MAAATVTPISSILSTSTATSKQPVPNSPSSIKTHKKNIKQFPLIRREFLKGSVTLLPLVILTEQLIQTPPPPAESREVEVGSYLPQLPSDPSFVLFKASPKDTPALRAGNVQPYQFILPPTWKQTRIANILSGNYCQPKCAEPWVEVKFEDENQGKVQVVASPLIRLTNKPKATIEDIGSPENVIASLGAFVPIALCVLLAFLGLAVAAAPSTPTWPKAFSASVFTFNLSNPNAPPEFFRWFHDIPQNVSRRDQVVQFDPKVPPAFVKIVVNGSTSTERLVYELPDGQLGCFQRNIRRHLLNPDFSHFMYVGQAFINYNLVNQWNARTNSSNFVSYFEFADSREPYRFRVFQPDGSEELITFTEFDASPQDPNLFEIPLFLRSICNNPPNAAMFNQQGL